MLLGFSTLLFLLTVAQIGCESWLVDGITIDNDVVGVPQIQCTEHGITFSVRTRSVFRGNIYVKGQFGIPACRQQYFGNDYPGATFTVRIGECGMRRIRQLQPHGLNYMVVFVTNFHPQFITKVDRAFNVRCFYAQSDKTVNSELEVSVLRTESVEQATMLMPNCEYSVRAGSVDGPPVRFSRIGDQLVHRWECDNPNYGMLVKNCFVNDGGGTSVRVLDGRGCPVFSAVVQGPLSYDNSLNLAFVPVWAYKFPDRSQLYFQCQIQVCSKRDNECIGVTPPNCPNVIHPDFIPNSLIDAGVDPTQVIGTFTNPHLLQSPLIVRRADQRIIDRVAINDVHLPPGDSCCIWTATSAAIHNSSRELHPLHRNGTRIQDTLGDQTANTKRPNRPLRDATIQKPTDEELLETWTRDRLADDLWRSHRRPERTSRVEDETLDVLAQPIYISDSEPDEDGSTRDNPCDDSFYLRRFCITKSAFLVLLVLLAFFSVSSLVLLSYFARNLMRKGKKIAGRDASYTYTTSSSFSSISDDRPSNMGALVPFGALRQTPQMHFGCSYPLPR